MSSANPKVHEPSMEEILASIRRIIADDQEAMQGADQAVSGSPLRNVLELAERQPSPALISALAVAGEDVSEDLEAPQPSRDNMREPSSDSFEGVYRIEQFSPAPAPVSAPAPMPAPIPVAAAPVTPPVGRTEKAAPSGRDEEALLSSEADASIFDAFTRLGSSLPASNPRTLEDIVKEMLRPMLKTWLDDNLPALVERLVQAEIERVTRGKR